MRFADSGPKSQRTAPDSRQPWSTSTTVARLTAGGLVDSSFNLVGYRRVDFGLVPHALGRGLVIRADGTMVVGGYISDGASADFGAAGLLANGLDDVGFGLDGRVVVNFGPDWADGVLAMTADPAGRLLLGGQSGPLTNADFGVLRLLADGTPDPTFGVQGTVAIPFDIGPASHQGDEGRDIHVLPDGGVLVVGDVTVGALSSTDIGLVRLQGGPDPDQLFGNGFELSP